MSASNPLARILETNRLISTNYKDWLKNFRIILASEKLSYVLDQEPIVLSNCPTTEQRAAFEKWTDEDSWVKCYMLASLSNKLQSQHEYISTARAMITHLQELYSE